MEKKTIKIEGNLVYAKNRSNNGEAKYSMLEQDSPGFETGITGNRGIGGPGCETDFTGIGDRYFAARSRKGSDFRNPTSNSVY